MYDPIFAKSFSRYERKGFGCCGLTLCLILAISICSTFKPHLHPFSLFGDTFNLELSVEAVQHVLTTNDTIENSEQRGNAVSIGGENLQLLMNATENMQLVKDTSVILQPKVIEKMVEPLCRKINGGADYCEIDGDIRIQSNTSTIFVVKNHQMFSNSTNSWTIQPYPRDNIPEVKYWTVKLVAYDSEDTKIPKCTQNHRNPAILFSMGGYIGNHFHAFADMLFPLYVTSFRFQKEVHFLASDFKIWWRRKYQEILNRLSKHQIVDIDQEKWQVRCYQKLVVGLEFYRELLVDQSTSEYPTGVSMSGFRQLLRQTYSLERKRATKSRKGDKTNPRLLIVSRKRTRVLINEVEVSRVARKLGFEVVFLEAFISTNQTKFAQQVNSCNVMMGIHGAGLTNMLFLADNAILIQIVPFGKIDIFARLDFGAPAAGMNIRYLEYKISLKESSLTQQYPIDHPVIKDPMSIHRKGWGMIKSVYLESQNVTVDIKRFKGTLVRAMKLSRN